MQLLAHCRGCESHCSGSGDADDESGPFFRFHDYPLLNLPFLRGPRAGVADSQGHPQHVHATSHQAAPPEVSAPLRFRRFHDISPVLQ